MRFQTLKQKAKKLALANGHDVKGVHFFIFNSDLCGAQCRKCEHWVFIDTLRIPEFSGELTKRKCDV